jgi:hypothetical protein
MTNSIIIQITSTQVSSKNKFIKCMQEMDATYIERYEGGLMGWVKKYENSSSEGAMEGGT